VTHLAKAAYFLQVLFLQDDLKNISQFFLVDFQIKSENIFKLHQADFTII